MEQSSTLLLIQIKFFLLRCIVQIFDEELGKQDMKRLRLLRIDRKDKVSQ